MAHWVIPLYIISGIVMAIGAYFTIRYRPYCTLKSPEREIAMELHRKKLMNEPINEAEEEENLHYKIMTKKYSFGDFLLLIGILIHLFIFAAYDLFNLSSIYFLSIFCLLPILIVTSNFTPYCFISFLASFWKINKEHFVSRINVYQKQAKDEALNSNELYVLKNDKSQQKMFEYYRYSLILGVVLHLLLDVWFGLNGSLIIN